MIEPIVGLAERAPALHEALRHFLSTKPDV